MMNARNLSVFGLVAGIGFSAAAERVSAYDSEYTEATGYVTLKGKDDSHTASWDSAGNWSTKAPPVSTTNYYVGSACRLNVKMNDSGQTPGPFAGAKLVVAGQLWDYGVSGWHGQLGDNVTMLPGSEYYMTSAGHIDSGSLLIRGTVDNPVQFTFDNGSTYNKTFRIAFASAADGCVTFVAKNRAAVFNIAGSMPDFLGKLQAWDGNEFRCQSLTMPGTVDLAEAGCVFRLLDHSGISTVGGFSAVAGAQLQISDTDNTHVLYVTNRLELAAGSIVKTDKFKTYSRGVEPQVYPTIRLSAEAVAAGLPDLDQVVAQTYSMNGRLAEGIIPELRLVYRDLPDGEKSIDMTYYKIVSLTNNTLYSTTPFRDKTDDGWSEAANGAAHYWDDGMDPSPDKDYYVTDSYGATFRASHFDGHALVLKGGVYFGIYRDWQTIPLIVDAASRIRLMSNVGQSYELAGTIRKEGPKPMIFGAGNQSHFKVSSTLSGSGDVLLKLNPEKATDPKNFVGTIEFSGDNSAYLGRIHVVAGEAGDFGSAAAFSGRPAWVPSAVSNVTFEVTEQKNLGGKLAAFACDALSVSNECRLVLKETSVFDEPTRGWYFAEKAYLSVPAGKHPQVKSRITLGSGATLEKEGEGAVWVGDVIDVADSSTASLAVREGIFGVAVSNALFSLDVNVAAGAKLGVPFDGLGIDLNAVNNFAYAGMNDTGKLAMAIDMTGVDSDTLRYSVPLLRYYPGDEWAQKFGAAGGNPEVSLVNAPFGCKVAGLREVHDDPTDATTPITLVADVVSNPLVILLK